MNFPLSSLLFSGEQIHSAPRLIHFGFKWKTKLSIVQWLKIDYFISIPKITP